MSLKLKFPAMFYIEPTNDCNLSCIMCPRKQSKREIGYMPLEFFREIIDQLSHQRIICLNLHQLGEPLLHPYIAQMVRYAKDKGVPYVRFATNATLLKEDLSRELIASGLDSITVSMDTVSAARYCRGTNEEDLFLELDYNILQFIKLRNHLKLEHPKLHMQIINLPSTRDIIEDFVKKWQGQADMVTVREALSWAGRIGFYKKPPSSSRLICVNHLTQGAIGWEGTTTFCCLNSGDDGDRADWALGNAKEMSLENIFLGEKRRKIIESQLRGNYEVVPCCKRCADWDDYLAGFRRMEKHCETAIA